MTKKNEQNYVVTFPLMTNDYQIHKLNKIFEISRFFYNDCLKELLKRERNLKQDKQYNKVQKQIKGISKKIKVCKIKKEENLLIKERKELYKTVQEIEQKHGFSEYAMHDYLVPTKQYFGVLDINTAQKIATRAWQTVYKKYTVKSKHVHFKKYGTMDSIEGKTNKSGITFRINKNTPSWYVLKISGMNIPVYIKSNDIYGREAISDLKNIKYCRIVRKIIRGKVRYLVQLTIKGVPPTKRCKKTGTFKRQLGVGRVGIDIGTQTIAFSSDTKVLLNELAPNLQKLENEKRLLQRKLDRSSRSLNPSKYNENGTINRKNKDKWIRSNTYFKSLYKLKEISRKQQALRKQSHNMMTNELLTLGNEFYVETMNFKGLQKRVKETKISPKTGKFQRKKRFGKSIAHKAPSLFLSMLKYKLEYLNGFYHEVDTWSVKASQYNHMTDDYQKKNLSQRWQFFDSGDVIQRDCYSAFLIQHVNDDLKSVNKEWCNKKYDHFKDLHDKTISNLKLKNEKTPTSMGV